MTERHQLERQALRLMAKGQWQKAILLYEQLIHQFDDPNLYNLLGDLYLRVGRIREALNCYSKALEGFMADQLFSAAVAVAHKILRRDPEQLFPYIQIASVYAQQGYIQDAVETLQRCLSLSLTPQERKQVLGVLKSLIGHVSPSDLDALREIYLALKVEDPEVSLALGLQTLPESVAPEGPMKAGETEEKPLVTDVGAEFFYLLREVEAILSEGFQELPASLSTARALYELGLYHETILELQDFLSQHPKHSEATLLLGKAFLKTGDLDLALRAFRQGYEACKGPQKREFLYWIGRTHEKKGETETALRVYREILYQDLDFLDVKQRIERLTPGISRVRQRMDYGFSH